MASRKISQREARQTRKQLLELRDKFSYLRHATYPGTKVWGLTLSDSSKAAVETTHRLGFFLAVRLENDVLRLYAVKP